MNYFSEGVVLILKQKVKKPKERKVIKPNVIEFNFSDRFSKKKSK